MEKEKIITLTEILDYSEDEEPPSGGESKISTFAFACVDKKVLRLPSLKFPSGSSTNFRRKSHLNVCFKWHNWRYPIKGIVVPVFQIYAFWNSYNLFEKVNLPNFQVSLYDTLNHDKRVVDYCLVKLFGASLWQNSKMVLLQQNYLERKSISSNQYNRIIINYQ